MINKGKNQSVGEEFAEEGARCRVLGARCWVLGTGYWVLGTDYWVLGTGYWIFCIFALILLYLLTC
jgi:hypothetical protein